MSGESDGGWEFDEEEFFEVYEPHSKAKHDILQYYLDIWTSILSNHSKIRMFDCFAGRGRYDESKDTGGVELRELETNIQYPGSPLILLDVLAYREDIINSAELILIEKRRENIEELKRNISETTGFSEQKISIHPYQGKFEDKIDEALLDTGGYRSIPSFFFIDPYGVTPLEYDLITRLASQEKWETFITLMAQHMHRFRSVDNYEEIWPKVYGKPDWKEELDKLKPQELEHQVVEYYCRRLEEGGASYTIAYMIADAFSEQMKYYMTFTSNSPEGMRKMKESMQRLSDSGTLAYAPKRQGYRSGQQKIDSFNNNDTKRWLLTKFASKKLSFREIVQETFVERKYDVVQQSSIRDALHELEDQDRVDITRIESVSTGIAEGDIIEFYSESS